MGGGVKKDVHFHRSSTSQQSKAKEQKKETRKIIISYRRYKERDVPYNKTQKQGETRGNIRTIKERRENKGKRRTLTQKRRPEISKEKCVGSGREGTTHFN
jgi:hypothetical protein